MHWHTAGRRGRYADDGYPSLRPNTSHQFKHSVKAGRVTVPGKPNDDLAPGTLNSILKQADLKK